MAAAGFWSSIPDSKHESPADILLNETKKLCVFGSYNNLQAKKALTEFSKIIIAVDRQCGVIQLASGQAKSKVIKQIRKMKSAYGLDNFRKLKLNFCFTEPVNALPLADLITPNRIKQLIDLGLFEDGSPPNWADLSATDLGAFFAYYQSAWDSQKEATLRATVTSDEQKREQKESVKGQLYLMWYKAGVPDKIDSRSVYIEMAISCVQKTVVDYGYMDCALATDAMLLQAIWLGYPGTCVRFHNDDDNSEDLNVFVLDSKGKVWPEPGCIVVDAWSSSNNSFCWTGDNISTKVKQPIFRLNEEEIPIFRKLLEKAGYAKWHESSKRISNITTIKERVKDLETVGNIYLSKTPTTVAAPHVFNMT